MARRCRVTACRVRRLEREVEPQPGVARRHRVAAHDLDLGIEDVLDAERERGRGDVEAVAEVELRVEGERGREVERAVGTDGPRAREPPAEGEPDAGARAERAGS